MQDSLHPTDKNLEPRNLSSLSKALRYRLSQAGAQAESGWSTGWSQAGVRLEFRSPEFKCDVIPALPSQSPL